MAHQKNIIVATFPEESKIYRAFSEIKQLGVKRTISIHGLPSARRRPTASPRCGIVAAYSAAAITAAGLITSRPATVHAMSSD
jgi:hypothetical protein